MDEVKPCEASRSELADILRRHYEELSKEACDWHSGMLAAIDAYEREPELLRQVQELEEEAGQLQVQLAGCSVAALGIIDENLKPGDYGWSVAYRDVVTLRKRMEELEAENARLGAVAEKARKVTGNVIRCVVAMDDEPGLKERWRCVKEDDLRQLREALAALEEVQNHEMENREQP